MTKRQLFVCLIGLCFLACLPLLGRWARRDAAPRCSLDGMPIEPLYRARLIDADGQAHEFCCVWCAAQWLKRANQWPQAVFVTDETTGEEIEAGGAVYVRSMVTTSPTTGNRVHVFRMMGDALAHVAAYGGEILIDVCHYLLSSGRD